MGEAERIDILVAGGGIAGLSAAARLGGLGLRVVCIEPEPPGPGHDWRTTAYLQPGIDTLTEAGAWAAMEAEGAPLWTMRLVDAGGVERKVRTTADFTAAEVMDRPFGHNVPNTVARAALAMAAGARARVIHGARVSGLLAREDAAFVRLDDGRQFAAQLVVAADGRESGVRALAGIGTQRWSYRQVALVFAVTHPEPHRGVSTEIHRTGGPLTLVPLPDRHGQPCSSVVWMVPARRGAELAELDDVALGAALTAETMGLFGPLSVDGPSALWPIIGLMAQRLTGRRLALVAEAAHVVPPIGAQGLNLSLADIEALARLVGAARERGEDIGGRTVLNRYAAARAPEIAARVAGVDVLNRLAQAEPQVVRDLRVTGLRTLHGVPPLRRLAMRLGLGGR